MKTNLVTSPFLRSAAALRPLMLVVLLGLLAAPRALHAQAATNTPPARVSYQGFLTDGAGAALAPSTPQNFTVDFKIFGAPSGGAVLWSERQVVTVDKGNFSVILGEGSAIVGENNLNLAGVIANRSDASDRFIQLTVTIAGTPTVINPRLRLLTTPYAFLATSARTITDANGANRVAWAPGNNHTEVTGDLAVTGVIKGNGASLTNISTASIGGIDATKITSGILDANRIPVLLPSKIGGTFTTAQIPTLTTGHIPPLDASKVTSGAFASDRIPTVLNGTRSFAVNLGIGTNSPQSTLHVDSGGAATGVRIGNSSASGKQWQIDSTGAGNAAGAGRLLINSATDGRTIVNIATNQVTVTTNLNVQGALTVGASQLPLLANSGTDSLRIIRGTVGMSGTTLSIRSGTGFTVSGGNGILTINFTTPFPSNIRPTVLATAEVFAIASARARETEAIIELRNPSNGGPVTSSEVHFLVFGPR